MFPRARPSSRGAATRTPLTGMWLGLALAAALFQVLRNTAMKQLGHALDEYINVWGRFTFLLPFALATCLLRGWPPLRPGFFAWCLAFGVCQTISTLALSKALKLSQISLVTALWKVSLLVLLGMAWITIGERPTPLGVAGVLLSAAGVYLLNISRARVSPWAPLVVLFTDRGQRYTLLAALFYAPSVITIKQAILASDAPTGTLGGYAAASLLVTPLALRTSARHFTAVPRHWKTFLALGLFATLTTISQGVAYTLTLSSYVEAVKQVEILFAMAIGVAFFGEAQRVRESAPGAIVMLLGMALLSLAG
jgi:drug/metabolite transporter (DMT)-like permease